MEREIDAVEVRLRLQFRDHDAHEMLIGILCHPARTRSGPWPERRGDADQLDILELARDLDEATHVALGIGGEQVFAGGRGARVDEVLPRRVVGKESHRLMSELENGDTDLGMCHSGLTS